ncbi:major facilitator superfamily MFS_1 [[Leptolyngbya] sp. PCC 7376]|uniref:MFS transporter n=1 Tax=[Leptolyngbya] sp. PCC 7376 TaxID=111781 RepID=UPI00029F160C|nr:MFS transporter [[Leptolyngbya] sp. PCC 7376]AFY36516.1 major facilitator superfamily MFS_1 [[Leptolyngbya] sp. PCC 7376]
MKVFLQLERKTQVNLAFLFLAALGFWLSMTSLLPVLPAYIQDLGASDQQVGFVMGCFAIGLLLSRAQLGKMADEKSRKLVIMIGAAVVGIAPWGYIFLDSIPEMMVWRAFHGLSIAAFTTGYSALVVDLAPAKNRGEIVSYMSLAIPIGMSIGPVLGGYLLGTVGYPVIFSVSALCGMTAFIFASQAKEKPRVSAADKSPGDRLSLDKPKLETNRQFRELMAEKSLYIPALVMLCIGLVFGTLVTFLPLHIRELGIDFNTGLFYGAAAISSFSIRILIGKASDQLGRGLFISGSLLCYALTMICLANADQPPLFILAGAIEGVGAGTLIPMMIALMSDRSSSNERGKVYSLCIGGFDVGIAAAGFFLGTVTQTVGYQGGFAIAAGLSLFAFVLFLTQGNQYVKSSLQFAVGKTGDRYAQKL